MASTVPDEYRSPTEYQFPEDMAEKILSVCAYHRKDFGFSMIWFPEREHLVVRESKSISFRRIPGEGLGRLDLLPLELLHDVIERLDMLSLQRFREVNLASMQTVDSMGKYETVLLYGATLLRAILRTELAYQVCLSTFYSTLCTRPCSICGEFGGFVSIIEFVRCCFACSMTAWQTRLQSLASARKQFHLTKAECNQMVSFKSLPGRYTMDDTYYKSRVLLVSCQQALLKWGSRVGLPRMVNKPTRYDFMGSCALPYFDQAIDKVDYGVSCAGCQLAREKGIWSSNGEGLVTSPANKVYSQEDFLKHFQWCGQAQLLWDSSNEGEDIPPALPFWAKMGGYFNQRDH